MTVYYWIGGAGNWSSTAKWSLSSGGTTAGVVPTATDDVIFDANSGLVGVTATVDTAQTCATLTLTPSATVGFSTIAITASLTVTGALSMSGTAGNRRFLVRSTTYGIATNFIVGSASGLSDLDFRDLFVTGAAAPLTGTRIGDLRGVTGVTFSTPKTVYWNLAGAQDWSANGWAATSGGSPATSNYPLAQDTAVFDNTGSVTGNISISNSSITYTGTVDMSARTSAMTLVFNAGLTVYGNWVNGSGTVISGSSAITFSGRNTQSITSASKTFTAPITIDTYGGTVQLIDPLNLGALTLTVTNGTFTTNGQNITANILSSSNSNVRAINLGASTLTLSSSSPILFTTPTNLTFNAGTSTINLTSTGAATFNGGGLSFNDVSFIGTTAVTHAITGANTFANLTFTAPAAAGLMGCSFAANQTITGTLTCAGASAIRRIFLRSDTVGTQRTLTCATVSAQDCDFRDIAIAGAAAPYNAGSLRVGDCGGNSGITFPGTKTVYWNLGGTSASWSSTGWSNTSGGTPNVIYFPLAQDTATFDTGSVPTGNISIDANWNIGTFDASGRTGAMGLTNSGNSPVVYGNWRFGTGVSSVSTTGAITFSGRGTQTITSNGITFGCAVTIDSSTGTVQLSGDLTLGTTRTLTLTSGTFDAGTANVSVGLFSGGAGTLKMGSGTWTLSGVGTIWANGTAFNKGTANIVLSDTSTSARTFSGAGYSYNKLTIGGTTGISTLTITGNNQFTELASTKTVAHTIALGATTQTFGAWTVTGTVGNVVTVSGTATLTITGARVSGVDYLAMGTTAISTTSPGEFYAGANSTGTGTGVILTAAPAATVRYWRGGGGTWDTANTTNWATASGGLGPASVPTSADDVIFDTLSNGTAYTVTCTATQLRCASLTMAGPATGNITWAGTAPLAIHGNVVLPATGMTRTYTGAITLTGSATGKTLTTNGVSLTSAITVNGVGCGWTLGSALVGISSITVTNGAIDFSTFNFTGTLISSVNANTRSINLGSSTIDLSSTSFSLSSSEAELSNLTFSAGTSQINLSNAGAVTFSGGNKTFNNVSFTGTLATVLTINGANTFSNLSFAGRVLGGINAIIFGANQTITSTFTINTAFDASARSFLQSDTLGTARTITCASFSGADADFRDITIAGAAAPVNGTRLGDCKGNSGITFPAGVPKYWNLAAGGNWSAIAWCLTTSSSETPVRSNFPLPQDTPTFTVAGLTSGNTVSINANYNIGTIDMSLRTADTMILATGSQTPYVYGNWINGSGCSFTGTGAITFAGRGSQTITSAGAAAFTQPFTINTPGGSVTLADALLNSYTSSTALQITSGTFNANNQNLTFSSASGGVSSNNSNVRTVAIGSGVWTIAGTAGWNFPTSTNLTVTGTGTIKLTSASAKTFAGGSVSYTNITLDQGGAGQLNITGNNTFKDITNTSGVANTISFASTSTTLLQFSAAGTSGNLLTISGTSAASPATLIYTGASTVGSDYLTINNIKAYPTTSTWYAGTHSTNGGSLGWIFTAGPTVGGTSSFFLMF